MQPFWHCKACQHQFLNVADNCLEKVEKTMIGPIYSCKDDHGKVFWSVIEEGSVLVSQETVCLYSRQLEL